MQQIRMFISLGSFLLLFLSRSVAAVPKGSTDSPPFLADPCYQTIAQAVETVRTSSQQPLILKSAELQSETSERVYLLKFDGLVGAHRLILENDSTNRCFVIQLSYEFKSN